MRPGIVMIRVAYLFYLYAVIKIILFKFQAIDMTFLLHQLKLGWTNPDHTLWRIQHGNLSPLEEISRALHARSGRDLMNVFGNIAIFIPFGVFHGLLGAKRKISCIEVSMRALGASLCLESAQALFAIGQFDVDDLLLNTIGGLMGFLIFRLWRKISSVDPNRIRTGGREANPS